MLVQGRRYVSVPELTAINGRKVFATMCGAIEPRQIAVPQVEEYTGRPVRASAVCFDGQLLEDWRVVSVPQEVDYQGRPVYAFNCCPLQVIGYSSSSSSSSSSVSSSSSSSVSSSSSSSAGPSAALSAGPSAASSAGPSAASSAGPSAASSAGSSSSSGSEQGIQVDCCPAGELVPTTLYITISDAGNCACFAGTYVLTFIGFINQTYLWYTVQTYTICGVGGTYIQLACDTNSSPAIWDITTDAGSFVIDSASCDPFLVTGHSIHMIPAYCTGNVNFTIEG